MSGNKNATSGIERFFAIGGGIWGGVLAIGTIFRQLDLGSVLRGEMRLDVALSIGGNALPVLALLLLLCLITIGSAARRDIKFFWTGISWLTIGGILLYGVYLTRFSLGLLLLPSASFILIAGLLLAAQKVYIIKG